MRLRPSVIGTVVVAFAACVASSCATAPTPGDPAYPFNLDGAFEGSLSLADSVYPVSAEIRTLEGGTVRGVLRSTGEVAISGDFTGTIRADSVVWRSSWTLIESGCGGVLLGWGGILPSGAGAEGRVRSEGSCPASRGAGSFRFLR